MMERKLMTCQEVGLRQIPLLDLKAQHRAIREEVMAAVTRVIDSQRFILGEEVEALEHEIAAYCGTRHAVGCASGSDALILALSALGVGPGDEVLTTPYTFFATAGAIHHVGARPVFVDIEPDTFNIDVNQAALVLASRPSIRAIIPVHLFGGCADMDPLIELGNANSVPVIEDAAQAIGAKYKDRRAGSIGAVGCFSFFPSKNLGGYGDGGMLTTNDDELAARLKSLRMHGSRTKYFHESVGYNSRLDALQAAVLRVKLKHLDNWTEARRRNADLYRVALAEGPVELPRPAAYQTRHIYNQFVIRSPRRNDLQRYLTESQIGTEVYYPVPLHLQQCFAHLGGKPGDFPVSEQAAAETLALPIFPELVEDDINYVAGSIQRFSA
jgi:dTDP-4-amino-4,6-dideoxygalactose transaminase